LFPLLILHCGDIISSNVLTVVSSSVAESFTVKPVQLFFFVLNLTDMLSDPF